MSDPTVRELQARRVTSISPRVVDHWLNVFSRAALSLVLAFFGILFVTAVLLAGVVGAPVVAFALAVLAVRRRYALRVGAFVTTG